MSGVTVIPCQCATEECEHASDCAIHNEPAEPAGECNCRLSMTPAQLRARPGAHYSDGRRWSRISKAWIFAEDWNDREEVARLTEVVTALEARVAELTAALGRARSAIETFAAMDGESLAALGDVHGAHEIAAIDRAMGAGDVTSNTHNGS